MIEINKNLNSKLNDINLDNFYVIADFDKTIQGTISRCVDPTIGKYIVKYQNSSFHTKASRWDPCCWDHDGQNGHGHCFRGFHGR